MQMELNSFSKKFQNKLYDGHYAKRIQAIILSKTVYLNISIYFKFIFILFF